MAPTRQRDTGPEMSVRRTPHSVGYHYSLRPRNLPGRHTLVFGSRHKVVFAHVCFLHGHHCRKGRLPTSRIAYWSDKVSKKKARDARDVRDLADRGREVGTPWECEPADLDSLWQRLDRFLDGGSS